MHARERMFGRMGLKDTTTVENRRIVKIKMIRQ